MECERLNRLVRSWYIQVQDESLAPARMVEFMEKHVVGCDICLTDPDVKFEVKKITSIVLPPSKMTKQLKGDEDEDQDQDEDEAASSESYDDESDSEDDGDEDEDEEDEDFDPELIEDDDED